MGTFSVRQRCVCWIWYQGVLEAAEIIGLLEHIPGLPCYPSTRHWLLLLCRLRVAASSFRSGLRCGTDGHGICNLLDTWCRSGQGEDEPVSTTSSAQAWRRQLIYVRRFPPVVAANNGLTISAAPPTPWYKNPCVTKAIAKGALSTGIDAIGLIPGGGAVSEGLSLFHGAAAVSNGTAILGRVQLGRE